MSFEHHPSRAPSGADVVGAPMSSGGEAPHELTTEDAVADTLIGAVRACSPDYPPSIDYVRTALVDYVDAARARGETEERTTAAVRFMATTILTSAVWSGTNRTGARDLIRTLVTLCTERYAA